MRKLCVFLLGGAVVVVSIILSTRLPNFRSKSPIPFSFQGFSGESESDIRKERDRKRPPARGRQESPNAKQEDKEKTTETNTPEMTTLPYYTDPTTLDPKPNRAAVASREIKAPAKAPGAVIDRPLRVTNEIRGTYPKWWTEAWQRSAVSDFRSKFVADSPLFPSCDASGITWKGYPFVEPLDYIPNSKNPCWYELPKLQRGLKCLPYFYLAGVAKGGTTDLARRLRMHPQIFQGTQKEYHWWERERFGFFDDDEPDEALKSPGRTSFRDYVNKIIGRDITKLQDELREGSSVRIFGDYSPSYLWDPRNWYLLDGNQGCTEPRIIVGQHIRHVFPDAKVIMTFRHPTPRLYSRFVSRIPRTPFLRGSTPEDFHQYVLNGIKSYMKCFQTWSIRHCAYNASVYKESVVRLVEGMYPVFMEDWLRVWPRDQMFIMRYEDYGGHEGDRLAEVFEFLGVEPLSQAEMDEVLELHTINAGDHEYQRYGLMLNKTRDVLDQFYQPFITQFAEILQDPRFMWKDVEH